MALNFNGDYVNGSGVHVDYWKIGGINISTVHKYVDIQVFGFLSEEARLENRDIVEHKMVRCIASKFDEYFSTEVLSAEGNNLLNQSYKYIKENDTRFENSIDC